MYDYPKAARLRSKLDFRRTLDKGRKTVCPKLVLFGRERPADEEPAQSGLRLGLIVSRKVGNAVVRNRVKRSFRESFRHLRAELAAAGHEPDLDLVVIARGDAAEAAGPDLQAALRFCYQRHVRRRDGRA